MLSQKKKARPSAAGKANTTKVGQALRSRLSSKNMDAGKEISMVKPLSSQKSTSAAVKGQAETSSLSNSNLEVDILAADHDENLADKTLQSIRCKAEGNTVTSDVPTNSCALHDAIRSQSFTQVLKLLEENGTFSQDDLDRALNLACHSGQNDIVQKLVDVGANVHCRDADGNTPLMVCSRNGFVDLVQFLVQCEADVNAANFEGDTAVILSAGSPESANIVRLLLQQGTVIIDHQNREGCTALMKAVEAANMRTAYILLEYHHDAFNKRQLKIWEKVHHQVNCKGETAANLFSMKGFGPLLKCFETYIKVKSSGCPEGPFNFDIGSCDVNLLNTFFDSACVSVCDTQRIAEEVFRTIFEYKWKRVKLFREKEIMMVKRLVELGAKGDSFKDSRVFLKRVVEMRGSGEIVLISPSPVCIATEAGSYPLVEFLCEHPADVDKTANHNSTALRIAAQEDRPDLIELLLRHGADINNNNRYSGSALHKALSNGHIRCVKLLLQNGAVLDVSSALTNAVFDGMSWYVNFLFQNYEYETNLHFLDNENCLLLGAVQSGNIEIIKRFLQAGADINKVYFPGHRFRTTTPLAECKDGEVARFLIERGANVNAVIRGRSSEDTVLYKILTKSSVCNLTEVVRVLLQNGASGICDYKILKMAASSDNVGLLQLILDHGADLRAHDSEGNTLPMNAIIQKTLRVALFLINYAKDNKDFINARNHTRSTAMMLAVMHKLPAVIKALTDCGADVNA